MVPALPGQQKGGVMAGIKRLSRDEIVFSDDSKVVLSDSKTRVAELSSANVKVSDGGKSTGIFVHEDKDGKVDAVARVDSGIEPDWEVLLASSL